MLVPAAPDPLAFSEPLEMLVPAAPRATRQAPTPWYFGRIPPVSCL
jgi:hypothetical protein